MIRQAAPPDEAVVQRISLAAYTAAYRPVFGYIPKPATETYLPRITRGEVFLNETSKLPNGILAIERHPDHLLIYSIAVLPNQQTAGIGTRLMSHADTLAQQFALPALHLFTNKKMTKTIAFYQHCGFLITGERRHPGRPGETLIDMTKTMR